MIQDSRGQGVEVSSLRSTELRHGKQVSGFRDDEVSSLRSTELRQGKQVSGFRNDEVSGFSVQVSAFSDCPET